MKRLSPNYFEISFVFSIIIVLFLLILSMYNFSENEKETGMFFLIGAVAMSVLVPIMYFKMKIVYLGDTEFVIKRLFSDKIIHEISFSNLKELKIYDYIFYKTISISFPHSNGKIKKINFELGFFSRKLISQLQQISESSLTEDN